MMYFREGAERRKAKSIMGDRCSWNLIDIVKDIMMYFLNLDRSQIWHKWGGLCRCKTYMFVIAHLLKNRYAITHTCATDR